MNTTLPSSASTSTPSNPPLLSSLPGQLLAAGVVLLASLSAGKAVPTSPMEILAMVWQPALPWPLVYVPFLCRLAAGAMAAPLAVLLFLDVVAYLIARTLHLYPTKIRLPRSPSLTPPIPLETLPAGAEAQANATGVQVRATAADGGASRRRGRERAARERSADTIKGASSRIDVDGLPTDHLAGLTIPGSTSNSPESDKHHIPAFRDAMSAFTSPSVSLLPSRTPSLPGSPASPALSLIPLNSGEVDAHAGGTPSKRSPTARTGDALGLMYGGEDRTASFSQLRKRIGKGKVDWEGMPATASGAPSIIVGDLPALLPDEDASSPARQRAYKDAQKRYRAASVGVDGALGLGEEDASSSSSEEGDGGEPLLVQDFGGREVVNAVTAPDSRARPAPPNSTFSLGAPIA